MAETLVEKTEYETDAQGRTFRKGTHPEDKTTRKGRSAESNESQEEKK
jgi:hypothetical protein